jgi:hypothetical protein
LRCRYRSSSLPALCRSREQPVRVVLGLETGEYQQCGPFQQCRQPAAPQASGQRSFIRAYGMGKGRSCQAMEEMGSMRPNTGAGGSASKRVPKCTAPDNADRAVQSADRVCGRLQSQTVSATRTTWPSLCKRCEVRAHRGAP